MTYEELVNKITEDLGDCVDNFTIHMQYHLSTWKTPTEERYISFQLFKEESRELLRLLAWLAEEGFDFYVKEAKDVAESLYEVEAWNFDLDTNL